MKKLLVFAILLTSYPYLALADSVHLNVIRQQDNGYLMRLLLTEKSVCGDLSVTENNSKDGFILDIKLSNCKKNNMKSSFYFTIKPARILPSGQRVRFKLTNGMTWKNKSDFTFTIN